MGKATWYWLFHCFMELLLGHNRAVM